MPSDSSTSFSASYDWTAKYTSTGIFVLLLVITTAIHSLVVGCLGVLLLLGAYAWSPKGYTISERSIIAKGRPTPTIALYPMNGFHRQRWIMLNDAQKCGRRSRGASPVLFPVLKCLHTYTDQLRKLRLRKAGSFANDPDAGRADYSPPRRLSLAAQNGPGFAHAAQQFFKHLSFHCRTPL